MSNASAIFTPEATAGALALVNRARIELMLPEVDRLPGPRWVNPWENTIVQAVRAGRGSPELNAAGVRVWASLEHDGLHLFFDAMPEEHAEQLVAHTADSRRYAEQLVAHAALGPGRAPTRRGRRGGRALRARRERQWASAPARQIPSEPAATRDVAALIRAEERAIAAAQERLRALERWAPALEAVGISERSEGTGHTGRMSRAMRRPVLA